MHGESATLRIATRADIGAMHRVRLAVRENRLSDPARFTEADYVRDIEETGRGWVVEACGEVVAFAIGRRTDGNVWALFVDPAHEGRGYGTRLHDALVAWLEEHGPGVLWLTTDPGTRAERFYRARGWVERGEPSAGERRFERPARGIHAGAGASAIDSVAPAKSKRPGSRRRDSPTR